jgi:hypothetical protein
MMTSDESTETNIYLIQELATARKYNEVLEKRIIELMQDLRDSSDLLDAFVAYLS